MTSKVTQPASEGNGAGGDIGKVKVIGGGVGAPTSLLDLCRKIERRLLQYPPHQRGEAWPRNKSREWIEDLRAGQPLDGTIMTYELVSSPGVKFLNDGSQRMRATLKYYHAPEAYGDTKDRMEDVLLEAKMTVQERVYESWVDAYRAFIRVNYGTATTPYESTLGLLCYLPNYEQEWEPVFNQIHAAVAAGLNRMVGNKTPGRESAHRYLRDDYGIFYRFASADISLSAYETGAKVLSPPEIFGARSALIERKVVSLLQTEGIAWGRDAVQRFTKFVIDETALIEDTWWKYLDAIGRDRTEQVKTALYRWALTAAAWRRNNKVDLELYRQFLAKVIEIGDGCSSLIQRDDPKMKAILGLSDAKSMRAACKVTGIDLLASYSVADEPRRASRRGLRAGFEHSHLLPFSTNGEGPTISEPAILNRARGANPM